MNITDDLNQMTKYFPTGIFTLINGKIIIASFREEKADLEQNKVYLINPMVIKIAIKDDGNDQLSMNYYIPFKMTDVQNFSLNKDLIESVHKPKQELFDFYVKKIQEPQETKSTTKKKTKPKLDVIDTGNSESNVIHVDFKNRKNANNKPSLVNVYKDEDINPDPPKSA